MRLIAWSCPDGRDRTLPSDGHTTPGARRAGAPTLALQDPIDIRLMHMTRAADDAAGADTG
jgi:hypothetical protein